MIGPMLITEYNAINADGKVLKTYRVSKNNRRAAHEKMKFDFGDNGHFLKLKKVRDINLVNWQK